MRQRVALVTAVMASLLVGLGGPAAAYAPTPTAGPQGSSTAGAGQTVCTPDSKKVNEISGLVVTASGYIAVNDSPPPGGKARIFTLDSSCKLVGTPIDYPSLARDPEDLAVDKNGTLWIADIGDNTEATGGNAAARPSVALWTLPSGSSSPVINRVIYPDGKKRDAEALLISGDGTPVIITKEPVGEIWVPDGPLQAKSEKGVKLKQVGTFTPQETKTPNPLAFLGWKAITGAASSPDGTKIVVRTYSDAYEFDVTGGDVVKALTTGKPRITPLPNEARGEAIAYSADGKFYITASDVPADVKAPILKYTPGNVTPGKADGAVLPTPKPKDRSFLQDLTLQDVTYMVAGIGVLGLMLVVAGIIGIRRSRAKRRANAGNTTGSIRASAAVGGEFGEGFGPGGPAGPGGSDGPGGLVGPGGPGGPDGGAGKVYGARPPAPANAGSAAGGTVYGAGGGQQQAGFEQGAPSRAYDQEAYGRPQGPARQGFDGPGRGGQGYEGEPRTGKGFDGPGRGGQGYEGEPRTGKGFDGPERGNPGYDRPGFDGPGYEGPGYEVPGRGGPGRTRPEPGGHTPRSGYAAPPPGGPPFGGAQGSYAPSRARDTTGGQPRGHGAQAGYQSPISRSLPTGHSGSATYGNHSGNRDGYAPHR